MDLNNTPNPPGLDKPPVNYLPFSTIAELTVKLAKLNQLKKTNNDLIKTLLVLYNIQHDILEDGTIIIGPNAIPEVCLQEVTECLQTMAKNMKLCYAALGIVITDKQEESQPGSLYESLIRLLNNRNN
jgi:hypothetical protein